MQTNSTNSTQNNPTFQLQDLPQVVSRVPELCDESHIVTSFPSILDDNKVIPRVPAKPNTTSKDNPIFQLQDCTQVFSRVQFYDKTPRTSFKSNASEVEKTGLEQFDLLSYIRSVSIFKFLFKLNIDLVILHSYIKST